MRYTPLWFIAVCLLGCADPFVGHWEGTEDSAVDLDVRETDSGYDGDGHIYFCTATECALCSFAFDGLEAGDASYRLDAKFNGLCRDLGSSDIDCDLKGDTKLECSFADGPDIEYERVE